MFNVKEMAYKGFILRDCSVILLFHVTPVFISTGAVPAPMNPLTPNTYQQGRAPYGPPPTGPTQAVKPTPPPPGPQMSNATPPPMKADGKSLVLF